MKPWTVAPLGILLWACQPSHPEGWDTYGPALTQEVIALQHQYIELCHQKIQEKHYPLRGTKASAHYEKYDAPVDSTLLAFLQFPWLAFHQLPYDSLPTEELNTWIQLVEAETDLPPIPYPALWSSGYLSTLLSYRMAYYGPNLVSLSDCDVEIHTLTSTPNTPLLIPLLHPEYHAGFPPLFAENQRGEPFAMDTEVVGGGLLARHTGLPEGDYTLYLHDSAGHQQRYHYLTLHITNPPTHEE